MGEDAGFEVVDRRRVRMDGGSEEDAAAATAGEAAPETAPVGEGASEDATAAERDMEPQFNPFAHLTAAAILHTSVGLLVERAWIAMGMTANPATGRVEADFADARLAIDVLGDLVRHLEPHLDGPARREVQTELTNLRLNFVRQKSAADQ